MFRWRNRGWSWPALAGMVFCTLVKAGFATETIPDPASFLEQTEALRTRNHPQFVRMLAQLHSVAPRLNPTERWRLRYLDAWETMFEGDYARSETQLHDVIDHSGDATLAAKSSALLLSNLGANRRYEEAFSLANRLTTDLPRVRDRRARSMLLINLSQMLILAGQTDLAIKYARMLEDATPPEGSLCYPFSLQAAALYSAKQLRPSSPQLQRAVDSCVAGRQPVVANTMWLVLGTLYLDAGQPGKTLALLDRIEPAIQANHYYPHILSAHVQRAQAYLKLGDDDNALKAALGAIAMADPDEISEWIRDAYEVLYRVQKKHGHLAVALSYYEHYVAQDKGYLDDISARTLAYQVVQQRLLVKKLETEELSKQNNILRLQQALDAKSMETSRLYIFMLLTMIAVIALWLYRLKRSQLRFKRLARHDSLTGILNHQHFISGAERLLCLLQRRLGQACLVSIDLDHFKQVNDSHGHAMGDAVLRRTVAICQQQLRPTDLFGRLGGEEFGILLHDCSGAQGMDIADRIRLAIETTPMEMGGCVVSVSASVGLACTDTCGHDLQQLCKEADAALYRAKRAGRNRVIADSGSPVRA